MSDPWNDPTGFGNDSSEYSFHTQNGESPYDKADGGEINNNNTPDQSQTVPDRNTASAPNTAPDPNTASAPNTAPDPNTASAMNSASDPDGSMTIGSAESNAQDYNQQNYNNQNWQQGPQNYNNQNWQQGPQNYNNQNWQQGPQNYNNQNWQQGPQNYNNQNWQQGPQNYNYNQQYNQQYNNQNWGQSYAPFYRSGMGVASLVLGILSLLSFWLLLPAIIMGALSLVFGILQIRRAKEWNARYPDMKKDKDVPVIGIVLSAIAIVLTVVFAFFAVKVVKNINSNKNVFKDIIQEYEDDDFGESFDGFDGGFEY